MLRQVSKHICRRLLARQHKGSIEAAEHAQHLVQVHVVSRHAEYIHALHVWRVSLETYRMYAQFQSERCKIVRQQTSRSLLVALLMEG